MKINEIVENRRKELGIDVVELAKKCSLTISGYSDIEDDETEFYMVVTLGKLITLCDELKLDLIELFGFDECREKSSDNFIAERINKLELDVGRISDEVGITEEAIELLITDGQSLSNWVMDPIIDLSNILKVNVSCLIKTINKDSH